MADHTIWHKSGHGPGEPPPGIYCETEAGMRALTEGMDARRMPAFGLGPLGTWSLAGIRIFVATPEEAAWFQAKEAEAAFEPKGDAR